MGYFQPLSFYLSDHEAPCFVISLNREGSYTNDNFLFSTKSWTLDWTLDLWIACNYQILDISDIECAEHGLGAKLSQIILSANSFPETQGFWKFSFGYESSSKFFLQQDSDPQYPWFKGWPAQVVTKLKNQTLKSQV